jgi:hypothetical protein
MLTALPRVRSRPAALQSVGHSAVCKERASLLARAMSPRADPVTQRSAEPRIVNCGAGPTRSSRWTARSCAPVHAAARRRADRVSLTAISGWKPDDEGTSLEPRQPVAGAYRLNMGADIICCGCTGTGREPISTRDLAGHKGSLLKESRRRLMLLRLDQFRAPTIARQNPL